MKRTQKKSLFRGLITMMMVVALCVSMAATAFAALDGNGAITGGTEASPVEVEITKLLKMADGVSTPGKTFTFKFAKVSKDGLSGTADLAAMPVIADKTTVYTAADAGTTTAGVKEVSKATPNIFAGITFSSAGVYEYTITEDQTSVAGTNETITMSQAEYTLRVYVANGTTNPFIEAVGIEKTKDDDGNTLNPTEKVDGGIGEGGLSFANIYRIDTDGTIGNAPLTISKTVSGSMGSQTKYFDFEIDLVKPAIGVAGTPTYKAYIVEAGAVVAANTDNYAGTWSTGTPGDCIDVTPGTQEIIRLKHGQSIAFADIHYGATYEANELAATGYTPTIALTANGVGPTAINGTISSALATGIKTIGNAGANNAAYTNAYQTVTPTGVIINNLPFIMIIAVAVGSFVAFVAVKTRKRRAANN